MSSSGCCCRRVWVWQCGGSSGRCRPSAARDERASRPKEGGHVPPFIEEYLTWGAGPRAAQFLILGAKARAVFRGRYNVSCDDVRAIAHPVMRHRLFTNFNADAEGLDADAIVSRLIQAVPEPSVKDYGQAFSPARGNPAATAPPPA